MSMSHTVQVSKLTSSLSESTTSPLSHTPHTTNTNNNNNGRSNGTSREVSPLMVYQASLILYEMSRRIDAQTPTKMNNKNNNQHTPSQSIDQLRNRFSSLLSTTSEEHLANVIIKDITTAFLHVSQSYRNQSLNTSNHTSLTNDDVLMALRSLSGLIVHSQHPHMCRIVFHQTLCTEMALLYHHSILHSPQSTQPSQPSQPSHHNPTNANDDTIPACILSILSTLLIHGLILPQPQPQPHNDNDTQHNSHTLPDEDHTLHKIMDVFQTLASASPSTTQSTQSTQSTTNTNTPSMVGCCLGDLRDYHLSTNPHTHTNNTNTNNIHTIHQAIEHLFHHKSDECDTTQKDYLLQILQSCPQSHTLLHPTTSIQQPNKSNTDAITSTHHNQNKPTKTKTNNNNTSALHKRIQQIKSVFPNLGEGFIETALACYNHDAQTTITALIDADSDPQILHPRLRVLDRSLPARKKESKARYEVLNQKQPQEQQQQQYQDQDKDNHNHNNNNNNTFQDTTTNDREVQEEQEAYRIQKRHLQEMDEREEALAIQLDIAMRTDGGGDGDEYDDDYDDQYDGIGDDGGGGGVGKIGRADGGGGAYDVDLNAIRAYNKVAREMEEDRTFWEESRNTNRKKGGKVVAVVADDDGGDAKKEHRQNPKQDDGEANEKKYRGPDKGKKGRLIGPDGKYLPITKGRKKNIHSANGNGTDTTDNKDGGKHGTNAPGQTTTGLTKIQKRRKNDNKAKLGNHHRKERAMKKAGM